METVRESSFSSESLYFLFGELLVFIGEHQQFTMVFFSDGYLTVTIMGTKLFYGSTKPSESLTKLFSGSLKPSESQTKIMGVNKTTRESNKTVMWANKNIGESNSKLFNASTKP